MAFAQALEVNSEMPPGAKWKAPSYIAEESNWFFAIFLAGIAGLVAGGGVFYSSDQQLQQWIQQGPPGTATCGNAIIGAWFGMFCLAPAAALLGGMVGVLLGTGVDCLVERVRWNLANKS